MTSFLNPQSPNNCPHTFYLFTILGDASTVCIQAPLRVFADPHTNNRLTRPLWRGAHRAPGKAGLRPAIRLLQT
jgi:hypothetical protein